MPRWMVVALRPRRAQDPAYRPARSPRSRQAVLRRAVAGPDPDSSVRGDKPVPSNRGGPPCRKSSGTTTSPQVRRSKAR
ncbi:hypothetical protein DQ226_13465 [Dietzia maris]|uniref:Uncharacterized protein n=1 Tax=Dietzia maris TaxID=37915 RepID=A0A365P836_9ACTN|nr:hypothetical protein DQ226_13465 [Dietzia maris]